MFSEFHELNFFENSLESSEINLEKSKFENKKQKIELTAAALIAKALSSDYLPINANDPTFLPDEFIQSLIQEEYLKIFPTNLSL